MSGWKMVPIALLAQLGLAGLAMGCADGEQATMEAPQDKPSYQVAHAGSQTTANAAWEVTAERTGEVSTFETTSVFALTRGDYEKIVIDVKGADGEVASYELNDDTGRVVIKLATATHTVQWLPSGGVLHVNDNSSYGDNELDNLARKLNSLPEFSNLSVEIQGVTNKHVDDAQDLDATTSRGKVFKAIGSFFKKVFGFIFKSCSYGSTKISCSHQF